MVVRSLSDFKILLQGALQGTEDSYDELREGRTPAIKTYLIETNRPVSAISPIGTNWRSIDSMGWYAAEGRGIEGNVFLDATSPRVWRVFSLQNAAQSDALVRGWIDGNHGLDDCWISRKQMLAWERQPGWRQRGVGLRFHDGLVDPDSRGYFSFKAWHGANRHLPDLENLLQAAMKRFAVYSVRWQRIEHGSAVLTAECYSHGKITFNRATSVDEVLNFSSAVADRYEQALIAANAARDRTMGAFELDFAQELDLDAFGEVVTAARGPMKLWLTEVESESDFRRYRGVDMHTWDRVFLDVGLDYAYMTIPGRGCVNAAPRLATIQGEDNAGRTEIFHDGVEMFA